ncbi:MAG: hypothetical protein C0613_06100 [Desulfobulbaceae bacterium]|nr:MAG: hypothetical protein C0613_06100 [Desulfobulbaceae bacterium]
MYRIRFHGRGGQGMKTASRILGTALFLEGFEVQDAPRYGAERRGAPMFAYVRAHHKPINERGIISRPALVVVSDDSLLAMAAAGVTNGLTAATLLAVCTTRPSSFYDHHDDLKGQLILFRPPASVNGHSQLSSCCAGAAAALLGIISPANLAAAVARELDALPPERIRVNQQAAATVFRRLTENGAFVREGADQVRVKRPHWLTLALDSAALAAPAIHAAATTLRMDTGLWRSQRPEIDFDTCTCCGLCNIYCPDGAISLGDNGCPAIDYQHCKGCLICLNQCPTGAISARPEAAAHETDEVEA